MPGAPRFLTLGEVAEILNTSSAQVYALVRRGELRAIKIGGRGGAYPSSSSSGVSSRPLRASTKGCLATKLSASSYIRWM